MTYTEIKERNGRKYYYRVLSVRKGAKIGKDRKYLGVNLAKEELVLKEANTDKELSKKKINKTLKIIIKKIVTILKKNKVKKAGIFGSYARGEQTKKSDVDIIIEPPKGIGYGFFGIALDLEKALKKKVDLITYNSINYLLRDRIISEEKRIL